MIRWPGPLSRRTLSALDASAPPPRRRRIAPAPRKEPNVMQTIIPRPPRPTVIDPKVLTETARALSSPEFEIFGVVDTDAGRIVTTKDGNQSIIVPSDRPDGAGQTGLLLYAMRGGRQAPKTARMYVPPTVVTAPSDDRPWTAAELDELSRREHVPAAELGLPRGPSRLLWVAGDPVKARAAWLHVARNAGVTPGEAAQRQIHEAAEFRRIVVGSGWLDASEVPALDGASHVRIP